MENNGSYLEKELYQLIKTDTRVFDFLQEGALDGLWYWDIDNPENEWMNKRFWEVLGYDPSEKKHLASEWQDIINQDDLKVALDNFEKHCLDKEQPYDQVVRYKHKNGSTVWIRCRGIAIRDNDGRPKRMLGTHIDITRLKEAEARYQRNLSELDKHYAITKLALEQSELLFEMAPDANLQVDVQGHIIKANIQAEKLFGYSKAELEQMNVSDLIPKGISANHNKNIQTYFKQGGARKMGAERGKMAALRRDGQALQVEITLNLISTAYGDYALATIRDMTKIEALITSLEGQIAENKKLEELTLIDPLTKIYNQRHFEQALKKEFASNARYSQPLSLILIDIDYFKAVNDKYGHSSGNEVLIELPSLINQFTRYGDTLARVGGEEFALILPHCDKESALVLAERIVFEAEQHAFKLSCGNTLKLTLSLGVTQLYEGDTDEHALFERADKALYESKSLGRNRVTTI
ncbi:sensor domain-containing diguanylate cyclase [Litorilituus sediminis]|uniref:diguanylate cyclase n=1 Tax=Litorilituus sediminis TaxID=718192 RepID=A0A4P6P4P6_9GAMM|nr:sensor domain-containing diguanylate cyclase [Litorilituus sediminis]QBG34285.1 sensor domain-containing diguanylate cyclase [Litorilituus sediminis]